MTHPLRLIPFLFEDDTTVRITDQNGDPWFIAADVCTPIGVKNYREAASRLDDDERGLAISDTPGGPQEHLIISESGLYALVLRSHAAMKPGTKAHRFRRWVTEELIPSIRKTGQYAIDAPPQSMPDQKALSWTEKRLIVGMYQNMAGARAAVEKALELGFGSVPALDAMLKQGEFRFLVDLDESGPSRQDGVH